MTNRIITYLTILVVVAMAALFALNIAGRLSFSPPETYIRMGEVRGSAIVHKNEPYTLNLEQQALLLEALNSAVPARSLPAGSREQPNGFREIILYRFGNSPDVRIKPIAWVGGRLLFSAPAWSQEHLIEQSDGALKKLIPTTYDHVALLTYRQYHFNRTGDRSL